jgi:hypothetical protein
MTRAEALKKIAELMEQEAGIFLDISGHANSEELADAKARLDEEIILLHALREQVRALYLIELEATGKPN